MARPTTTRRKAAAPAAARTPPRADENTASRPSLPEGDLVRVLVSSASLKGRRRAGHGFVQEPTELHVDAETLELLEGDPQLIVKRG